jgi:hypothetical protein
MEIFSKFSKKVILKPALLCVRDAEGATVRSSAERSGAPKRSVACSSPTRSFGKENLIDFLEIYEVYAAGKT